MPSFVGANAQMQNNKTAQHGGRNHNPLYVADDYERDLRWRIKGRLHACLVELGSLGGNDWDAVATILEGALDDIRAAS